MWCEGQNPKLQWGVCSLHTTYYLENEGGNRPVIRKTLPVCSSPYSIPVGCHAPAAFRRGHQHDPHLVGACVPANHPPLRGKRSKNESQGLGPLRSSTASNWAQTNRAE